MDYFNYLPIELIEIIFEKLNLNDLINLRIVNKRIKSISEKVKIKQLIVNDWSDSRIWFYTNDIANLNENNFITINQVIKCQSIFQLDKNLKRLFLNVVGVSFDLSMFDRFTSLEQIHFDGIHLSCDCKLSIKNLKIAEIYVMPALKKITLDTPNLFAFKSPNRLSDNFIFNYPSKILNYETHQEYNDDIKIFTNLEYLRLEEIDGIDINILSEFQKLKILDLILAKRFNKRYIDRLKNDINFLIKLKKNMKRTNLEIYLQGVKLIDQNKINQFNWQCDWNKIDYNNLEFQMKNYDLLKDNSSLSNLINYCDLINFINKIPSCLINKFPDIFEVSVRNCIDDEDQFIKFLNSLNYLSGLYFKNCDSNKSFYDKLIKFVYLYDLNELSINTKKKLEIDFEFILDLNHLKKIKTNQQIDNIDLINKLLIKNKKMNYLKFNFKKKIIKIQKFFLENKIIRYRLKLDHNYYDYDDSLVGYNIRGNKSLPKSNLNELILKLKTL